MMVALSGLFACGGGVEGPALDAADPQERKAALYALGPEGTRDHVLELLTLAESDPEPTVRRLAMGMLGPTHDPRAVPVLKNAIEDWDDKSAQLTAITALANLGLPEACEVLVVAYVQWPSSRDPVAEAVREALIGNGDRCKESLRAHKAERPDRVGSILVDINRGR